MSPVDRWAADEYCMLKRKSYQFKKLEEKKKFGEAIFE
jgi:hypothetical protein